MVIDKLVAILGFEVDRKGLDDYQSKLKSLASNVGKYVSILGAATFAMTKFAADASEKLEKLSQKIGISTQTIQEFEHAGTLAGESTGYIVDALSALKKKSEDVFLGDKGAIQSFMRLGLSVRSANGDLKTADELLVNVADRISSIRNPTIKRNILSGLGISEELMPLLEKGGGAISNLRKRAAQDVYIFSDKDKNNLSEVNASFRSTLKLLDSFKNIIGAKLAPIFSAILSTINAMLRSMKSFVEFITGNSGFNEGMERTLKIFDTLKNILYIIAKVLAPLLKYHFEQLYIIAQAIGKVFDYFFDPIYELFDDLRAYFSGDNSAIGEIIKQLPNLRAHLVETFKGLNPFQGMLESLQHLTSSADASLLNPALALRKKEESMRPSNAVSKSQNIAPVYNITINAEGQDFARTLEDKIEPYLKSTTDRLWRESVLYNGGNNTI